MIIQQIDSNYYTYVSDRSSALKSVLDYFGLIGKNGAPFKYVQVQNNGNHFPKGGNVTLPATIILAKDKVIFILNDSYSFPVYRSNTNSLVNGLNHFGTPSIINFGKTPLSSPFNSRDARHLNSNNGKKISVGNFLNDNMINKSDEFVQKMRIDNGRMVLPIARKFHDMLHLMGGNRNKLTGYVDLNLYLRMIKQPSMVMNNMADDIDKSNYVLNIPDEQVQSVVKVSGVEGNVLSIDFKSSAELIPSSATILHPTPYLVFTLKPLSILNQRFPFFITSVKQYRIFVSVILLDESTPLDTIAGGINLLK